MLWSKTKKIWSKYMCTPNKQWFIILSITQNELDQMEVKDAPRQEYVKHVVKKTRRILIKSPQTHFKHLHQYFSVHVSLANFNATETNITVGHQTHSKRYCHLTNHMLLQLDKMSSQKHPADQSSVCLHATCSTSSSDDTVPRVKKG